MQNFCWFIFVSLALAENPCLQCAVCEVKPGITSNPSCSACALGAYPNWPCRDDKNCRCASNQTVSKDCSKYISKHEAVYNSDCRKRCEENDPNLESYCIEEHYAFHDQVQLPTAKCYDNIIHGYEDSAGNHAVNGWGDFGKLYGKTETAYECQEACQKDPDCYRFQWRIAQGNSMLHMCHFKTWLEVWHAEHIRLEGSSLIEYPNGHTEATDGKYAWCNNGINYQCHYGGFECIKCPDMRCAYHSHLHVSGPKYCLRFPTECSLVSNGTSTQEPPVFTPTTGITSSETTSTISYSTTTSTTSKSTTSKSTTPKSTTTVAPFTTTTSQRRPTNPPTTEQEGTSIVRPTNPPTTEQEGTSIVRPTNPPSTKQEGTPLARRMNATITG